MKWEKEKKWRTIKNNSKKKWAAEAGDQEGNQSLDAWPKAVKVRITLQSTSEKQQWGGCSFGQDVRADLDCGLHWVSNLGIRSHLLGKAVLEVPNWSGDRCQRSAFQSLPCHVCALDLGPGHLTSLYDSMIVPDLHLLQGMKWSDTKAGAVGMEPDTPSNGEFPKLRYFLPPQLPRKWKNDGTNKTHFPFSDEVLR